MIKEYQIAVIFTIKAKTYEDALSITEDALMKNDNAQVVRDYEDDNEGQRVVYLPGIDSAGDDQDVPYHDLLEDPESDNVSRAYGDDEQD